jgi:hypothetical protein
MGSPHIKVEPLPAGRRVDVRRVAGQQHLAGPVALGRTSAPSARNRTASPTGGSTSRQTHTSPKHTSFANP